MSSIDEVITMGLLDGQGRLLWESIKNKNPSHDQILMEMRREQKLLAAYSKGKSVVDDNHRLMMRNISLLETLAWRVYMFGSRPTALYPGRMGEFRKRQRNDPAYWKYLSESHVRHGTVGCEQLNNLYRKNKRPCRIKKCTHDGQKYADKWLKNLMRREWEVNILRRYMY